MFEGAETAQPRMVCSSPTEISGFCYMFLFLALSVLELIKWMICLSCLALLLLPCSAKMITNRSSQIFPSHKISQLCEIKDAILLQGWTKLYKRQNEVAARGTTTGKRGKNWWRRWSQGTQKAKAIISLEIICHFAATVRILIPFLHSVIARDAWI